MRAQVSAYVAAHLLPLPAGPFAGAIRVLAEVNNVGGANIGLELDKPMLRQVMYVTTKRFTGSSRQLGCGELPDYQINATALHFKPGSVEIIGAPSAPAVRLFIHELVRRLRRHGYTPRICWMSIDNKVVTGYVGQCVALERIEGRLPGFETEYAPGSFPGMICTHQHVDGDLTFMLFEDGKVVALGIRDMRQANELYLRFLAMMPGYGTDFVSKTQTNKSQERIARRASEQRQRAASAGGDVVDYDTAMRISMRVQDYLAEARSLAQDTAHATTLRTEMERIIAEETQRGTKRPLDTDETYELFQDAMAQEEEEDNGEDGAGERSPKRVGWLFADE